MQIQTLIPRFLVPSTVILASLLPYGCSCSTSRLQGSRNPQSDQTFDLAKHISDFHALVEGDEFTAPRCSDLLKEEYEFGFAHINTAQIQAPEVQAHREPLMQHLFLSRLALRKKLREFHAAGTLARECADRVRDFFRGSRYLEEYLGVQEARPAPFDEKQVAPYLAGPTPYLRVNQEFAGFDVNQLKSGDLLMSRGNAFTSAAIARMAKVDAQFSHLGLFYMDPATGRKYMVEAHIEVGSIVRPFEEYLADHNMRVAVFRLASNPELAHRVASFAYHNVKSRSDSGKNIEYDFKMDMHHHEQLFCSEVIRWAYGSDPTQKIDVPLFPSDYDMKNRFIFDILGIQGGPSFAPADMEVDPRYELVAEWRDLSRVKDTQMKDAILTKFYEWMETRNYVLQGDLVLWAKVETVWSLRRWPVFGRLLDKKFPLNMNAKTIGMFTLLDKTSHAIYEDLEEIMEDRGLDGDTIMSFQDMLETIEQIRAKDEKRYRFWSFLAHFHQHFRPDEW